MSFELSDDDIVSMAAKYNFAKTTTSKVSEIKLGMINNCLGNAYASWAGDGVPGEVLLESGGGWQNGTIQIQIVFIPDEPELRIPKTPQSPQSPLDDLRSNL